MEGQEIFMKRCGQGVERGHLGSVTTEMCWRTVIDSENNLVTCFVKDLCILFTILSLKSGGSLNKGPNVRIFKILQML